MAWPAAGKKTYHSDRVFFGPAGGRACQDSGGNKTRLGDSAGKQQINSTGTGACFQAPVPENKSINLAEQCRGTSMVSPHTAHAA
jgi:hypothetical protein